MDIAVLSVLAVAVRDAVPAPARSPSAADHDDGDDEADADAVDLSGLAPSASGLLRDGSGSSGEEAHVAVADSVYLGHASSDAGTHPI